MLFRYRCVQEIFKRAISILGAKSVELSFAKNGLSIQILDKPFFRVH